MVPCMVVLHPSCIVEFSGMLLKTVDAQALPPEILIHLVQAGALSTCNNYKIPRQPELEPWVLTSVLR